MLGGVSFRKVNWDKAVVKKQEKSTENTDEKK